MTKRDVIGWLKDAISAVDGLPIGSEDDYILSVSICDCSWSSPVMVHMDQDLPIDGLNTAEDPPGHIRTKWRHDRGDVTFFIHPPEKPEGV